MCLGQTCLYFLTASSLAVSSANFWHFLIASAGVIRPAIISPSAPTPICCFSSVTYQSWMRGLTTFLPAFSSAACADDRPDGRLSPSVPPLSEESEETCWTKFFVDFS